MTRINAGTLPQDLCDSHLIAEYRELPRMVKFSQTAVPVDIDFCLNTGHMKSVVRYGGYLADRHAQLINEMRYRGFTPNHPAVSRDMFPDGSRYYPSQEWLDQAFRVVSSRINERLRTMKRSPTWTNRTRPTWTIYE
jgi:hypothetical protein